MSFTIILVPLAKFGDANLRHMFRFRFPHHLYPFISADSLHRGEKLYKEKVTFP